MLIDRVGQTLEKEIIEFSKTAHQTTCYLKQHSAEGKALIERHDMLIQAVKAFGEEHAEAVSLMRKKYFTPSGWGPPLNPFLADRASLLSSALQVKHVYFNK